MPTGRAEPVVCFIDGSNLYAYLRDTFGKGKVNLPKVPAYHIRQVADGYHEITAELFSKTALASRTR